MRERDEANDLGRKINEQQINVVVSGPQTYQPGAPNAYKVQTLNKADGQPVASTLDVRVLDSDKKVVYEEKRKAPADGLQLNLPPNLSFAPHSSLALEVNATRDSELNSQVALSEQIE